MGLSPLVDQSCILILFANGLPQSYRRRRVSRVAAVWSGSGRPRPLPPGTHPVVRGVGERDSAKKGHRAPRWLNSMEPVKVGSLIIPPARRPGPQEQTFFAVGEPACPAAKTFALDTVRHPLGRAPCYNGASWMRREVLPVVRPVRVLHCADLHLDRPFRGLEPEVARARSRELLETFRRIVALARERDVDLFIIAGDLFEHRWVEPETIRTVAGELERLGRPVLIAPGNHDPLVPTSYYRTYRWPANVRIFGPAWERVHFPELNTSVWGIGFDRWEVPEQPLAGFCAPAGDQVQIGVLHGSAVLPGIGAEEDVYAPFTAEQVAAAGLDYLALGHYHRAGIVGGVARYPGSPEGLDFGQQGEHGVLVGAVARGRADLDLVPVGRREYVRAAVDITGCGTRDEVLAQVRAAFPAANRQRHIYRLTLTGRHQRGLELRPEEIRAALQADFYALTVTSAAGPEWDLGALAGARDLRGAFVRGIQGALAGARNEQDRRRLELACLLGLETIDREAGGA